jgi:hypothetical protein
MREESTTRDFGMAIRVTNYSDIDEARAAAERLAEERGGSDAGELPEDLAGLAPSGFLAPTAWVRLPPGPLASKAEAHIPV